MRPARHALILCAVLALSAGAAVAKPKKPLPPEGYGRGYVRLYTGAVRPRAEVALVAQNSFPGASAVSLDGHPFNLRTEVDGRQVIQGISVFEVLPGPHTVVCRYNGPAKRGVLYIPGAELVETDGKPWDRQARMRDITNDAEYNQNVVRGIEESVAVDRAREAAATRQEQ